eukprot:NODE_21732_length_739_cov_5.076797.p1 GENE.NODE_21732_length_739_cov_5.076797~~NODE_21732_length_739_cov_5.076797.p1  ORF type:complete len:215 (+),score=21.37 NODE_21732_length_739_cov_5.076797:2-646(+)
MGAQELGAPSFRVSTKNRGDTFRHLTKAMTLLIALVLLSVLGAVAEDPEWYRHHPYRHHRHWVWHRHHAFCPRYTGSTCHIFHCQRWRSAMCVRGHCMCGPGRCSVGGRCVVWEGVMEAPSDNVTSGEPEEQVYGEEMNDIVEEEQQQRQEERMEKESWDEEMALAAEDVPEDPMVVGFVGFCLGAFTVGAVAMTVMRSKRTTALTSSFLAEEA